MCRLLIKTETTKEQIPLFNEALMSMKEGGPDSTCVFYEDGIVLGHNRLSIVDLSLEASQPMGSDDTMLLFNGEIYNHMMLNIQHHLECETKSDSEVIWRLYEKLGDDAFDLLDGEFAIVIWDRKDKKIKLVRDRSGVKPLYYSFLNGFIASSEIKGILPFIPKRFNYHEFNNWKTWGYTLEGTLFDGIYKLLPGQIRTIDVKLIEGDISLSSMNYGFDRLKDVPERRSLRNAVKDAIAKRTMADVPISCTLSGGLDSSIVAYRLTEEMDFGKRLSTYTIGFEGCENEFEQAKKVADFLGTNHTQVDVLLEEVVVDIDEILDIIEEPIDRGSLIPTFYLSQMIKEKVTLIGEGADECFGGYRRHNEIRQGSIGVDVYFDRYLRAMHTPIKPYFDIEDKNDFLGIDLAYEIPYYHTLRIDKCFMAFGIEARVPFLDPEVVSTANEIPFDQKNEKQCLRDAFRGELPDWILDTPKKALKVPFDKLIAIPEVEEVIKRSEMLKEEADYYYNNPEEHGRDRNLWNIYLFQKWYEKHFPTKQDQTNSLHS